MTTLDKTHSRNVMKLTVLSHKLVDSISFMALLDADNETVESEEALIKSLEEMLSRLRIKLKFNEDRNDLQTQSGDQS